MVHCWGLSERGERNFGFHERQENALTIEYFTSFVTWSSFRPFVNMFVPFSHQFQRERGGGGEEPMRLKCRHWRLVGASLRNRMSCSVSWERRTEHPIVFPQRRCTCAECQNLRMYRRRQIQTAPTVRPFALGHSLQIARRTSCSEIWIIGHVCFVFTGLERIRVHHYWGHLLAYCTSPTRYMMMMMMIEKQSVEWMIGSGNRSTRRKPISAAFYHTFHMAWLCMRCINALPSLPQWISNDSPHLLLLLLLSCIPRDIRGNTAYILQICKAISSMHVPYVRLKICILRIRNRTLLKNEIFWAALMRYRLWTHWKVAWKIGAIRCPLWVFHIYLLCSGQIKEDEKPSNSSLVEQCCLLGCYAVRLL
jgi:hypothetical protein